LWAGFLVCVLSTGYPAAAQVTLGVHNSGFLYIADAATVVPVFGDSGFSRIGTPIFTGLKGAWISPRAATALIQTTDGFSLVSQLGTPEQTITSVSLALNNVAIACWSGSGSEIELYDKEQNLLQSVEIGAEVVATPAISTSAFGEIVSLSAISPGLAFFTARQDDVTRVYRIARSEIAPVLPDLTGNVVLGWSGRNDKLLALKPESGEVLAVPTDGNSNISAVVQLDHDAEWSSIALQPDGRSAILVSQTKRSVGLLNLEQNTVELTMQTENASDTVAPWSSACLYTLQKRLEASHLIEVLNVCGERQVYFIPAWKPE